MAKRTTALRIASTLIDNSAPKSDATPIQLNRDLQTNALLTLPIESIDEYDKNPRREFNPNYHKIKESISNNGLNQPLVVTRRPSCKNYMIFKGGNTRLAVLRELYEETGDRKFQFVPCSYLPWTGEESEAIIGHLQENQMRKSLCFVDRARGVANAIGYLKSELNHEQMSLRQMREQFTRKGYSITLGTLSLMLYMSETIESNLPHTLVKGIGRPQVQKIRNLELTSQKVCSEFAVEKDEHYHLFRNVLKSYSGSTWVFDDFRRALEVKISDQVETSIHDVALRLDGYTFLNDQPLKSPNEHQKNSDGISSIEWPKRAKTEQPAGVYTVYTQKNTPKTRQNGTNASNVENSNTELPSQNPTENVIQPINPEAEFSGDIPKNFDPKLLDMKNQCYVLASKISKQLKFFEHPDTRKKIVISTGYWGIGYLITDFPPRIKNIGHTQNMTREAMWWMLLELSDLYWAIESARPLVAKLLASGGMKSFVKTGSPKVLTSLAQKHMKCSYPFLGLYNLCLRQLDETVWNQLNSLCCTYRAIQRRAIEINDHLFELPK